MLWNIYLILCVKCEWMRLLVCVVKEVLLFCPWYIIVSLNKWEINKVDGFSKILFLIFLSKHKPAVWNLSNFHTQILIIDVRIGHWCNLISTPQFNKGLVTVDGAQIDLDICTDERWIISPRMKCKVLSTFSPVFFFFFFLNKAN